MDTTTDETDTPLYTATLDLRASKAVREYQEQTGREIADIINGAVASDLRAALRDVENRDEANWTITADSVEEAATDRMAIEASEKPVNHTVSIELTPGQYGALAYLAEHDGYASVEDCLIGAAAGHLSSIADSEEEMQAFFDVKRAGDDEDGKEGE